ncbi:uncharacterized protein [Apostichopus japonicus]|uniref:uncharacterized protein n=1 Tax=Stichopus japonicus TaxID=307972 RepID=UPI003AB2ACA0
MASSIETSTLCTDDSVRQGLKRLRRQNAVPLDLNIIKMAKLAKDVTPPTPQDEETRLQWPSPTKRSSQSPPPTVSPLTEGYDEAGCKPTHDETEVIWVLDSDEEAELETPSVNARRPDVVAPKVSRHIKRRNPRCQPKRLFEKGIVVDEVQTTTTEHEKKLQRLAKNVICQELWHIIKQKCDDLCYGCSVDHPSQIEHDWCLMATDDERLAMFLDDSVRNLDIEHIFKTKYLVECRAMKINMPPEELWISYYCVHWVLRENVDLLRRIMLRISNND